MALVRNDVPILEYDTDRRVLLTPNRKEGYRFPPRAVMMFHWQAVERLAGARACPVLGTFVNITRDAPVFAVEQGGTQICLCAAPLGSAAAVQMMEFLIACGCDRIVAAGSCGALEPLPENVFAVPARALRDEGASYHYLPPARWVELQEGPAQALCGVLKGRGLSLCRCATWSTDGFFRETQAMVEARRKEGCSVVEMECAGLAACAQFHGVQFTQLLYTADSLAGLCHEERNWGEDVVETALSIAMEAAAAL